jgi:hypothetical protein
VLQPAMSPAMSANRATRRILDMGTFPLQVFLEV